MRNRLLVNTLLAFILIPLIIGLRDYIQIDILHDDTKYSGTFLSYLTFSYIFYLLIAPLFLFFVLLPYNYIILKISNLKKLTLIFKILLFQLILTATFLILGTYSGLMGFSIWKIIIYVLYLIPLSILFSSLIHYLVDKKSSNLLFAA